MAHRISISILYMYYTTERSPVMVECFEHDGDKRPTFNEILIGFEKPRSDTEISIAIAIECPSSLETKLLKQNKK